MSNNLANGSALTEQSWNHFVERLRHDCVGKGVQDHYTADAIFIVQALNPIYGIETDYADKKVILCEESEWFSPQEYWNDCDDEEKDSLNAHSVALHGVQFTSLDESDQWDLIAELDEHIVTGCDERWEYVNSHFTKAAAEAFIQRKKHDYKKGLRVYVEAQTHCWEYNTIKQAIIDGKIGFLTKNK